MKKLFFALGLAFAFVSLQGQGAMFLRGSQGAPPATPTDFRILVNTANAGVSNSDQFQFTGALGDYDVHVYDQTGTTKLEEITGLSNAATITIAAGAGIYELRVFPAATNGFNRINFNNGGDKLKLVGIRNWGDVVWSSFLTSFWGCGNMTSVSSYVTVNVSSVSTMSYMFFGCYGLASFDESTFSTTGVAEISAAFSGLTSLVSLDMSGFDLSSVSNFFGALGSNTSMTTLNLSGINTSSATNMSQFVRGTNSLSSLDVSSLNTSGVTNMYRMFESTGSLDIVGIEDLDISSVTDIRDFLNQTTIPTSRYDQLLINYEAQGPPTGLTFNGGDSKYTAGGAAEAARTNLINTYNWTITDGGPL